jgi:hypothetical protein
MKNVMLIRPFQKVRSMLLLSVYNAIPFLSYSSFCCSSLALSLSALFLLLTGVMAKPGCLGNVASNTSPSKSLPIPPCSLLLLLNISGLPVLLSLPHSASLIEFVIEVFDVVPVLNEVLFDPLPCEILLGDKAGRTGGDCVTCSADDLRALKRTAAALRASPLRRRSEFLRLVVLKFSMTASV